MRVAVVSWSSRRVGGIEDYVSIAIPALHQAGVELAFWHEVDVPADRGRIDVPPGVPDICAAEVGIDASIAQLRAWKPDVLYVQGLRNVEAEARVLEIAPAVFFLHTYVGTCVSGTKTFSRPTAVPCSRTFGWPCLIHYLPRGCGGNSPVTMLRLYTTQSERLRLLGRYKAILTHTNHMRDEMGKHGLHADVIDYPVEAVPAGETQPGDGSWRLLYVGRMESLKGGPYLIDALPAVAAAAGRPVRVTMAGDGPERRRWEARARDVEKTTSGVTVEFPGWLSQPQIGSLMTHADLLVVPSVWPEPFGTVGPAAGRHGLPAAAFAVGGIPQWLTEGVTGHLAAADPPTAAGLARAILASLADPRHHTALRDGAKQMAARFTMERHLPSLFDHLERAYV